MWLTGNKIKEEVENGNITIKGFDESKINSNSYNYSLGNKLLKITNDIIDLRKPDQVEEIIIPEDGYLLEPGECYLGSTIETFGSNVYASLVTGRSSIGRKFVTNHITAGLIDQGFFGEVTLEISCIKPTRIYANIEFGQIFWFETSGGPLLYKGSYQDQSGPKISKLGGPTKK
jgi:dCTP deaminase